MKKYRLADIGYPSRIRQGGPRMKSKIKTIIIHTTGYGIGLKRIQEKYNNDLAKIGDAYAKRMGNILEYKGHFLIDHVGKRYQFVDVLDVAYHSGSGKKKQIKARTKQLRLWWAEKWADLESPLDLPSWESGNLNKQSIGIDLLAHGNGAFSKEYSDAQYESLAVLVYGLCKDYNIPIEREYIVGHEDVDPFSRGKVKGGWDPGNFDWDRLFELIAQQEAKAGVRAANSALQSVLDTVTNILKGLFK